MQEDRHYYYDTYHPRKNTSVNRTRVSTSNGAMSVGQWIGTLIVCAIPLLNVICTLIWAFSSNTNPTKRNYARAIWVLALIIIVIAVIAVLIIVFVLGMSIKDIFAGSAA